MAYRDLTFQMSETTKDAHERVESKTKDASDRFVKKLGEWPSFVREVFGRLFRPSDTENPLPENRVEAWASKATSALEMQSEWGEARQLCRSHRVVAAEVANNLAAAVGARLGLGNLPDGGPAAADPVEMERRVRRLSKLHEQLQAAGDAEGAAEAQTQAEAVGKEWSASIARRIKTKEEAGMLPLPVMAAFVAEAAKQAKELSDAVAVLVEAGVGRGADGQMGDVPDDLVAAASATKGINEVLRLLGKMQEAHKAAGVANVGEGRLDVVGVTQGHDVTKLTATELGRLGHPLMRLDVMRRAVEGSAAIREQRGEKEAERGDFCIELDCSGSMWGGNEVMARAVCLAMMLRARSEGRRVIVVAFDDGVRASAVIERDGRGFDDAFRVALSAPGGGTDAVTALKATRAMLSPDERQRVDTVIITDGVWTANLDDVAALRRGGGEFNVVLVGAHAQTHKWVDRSWRVTPGSAADGALIMTTMFDKPKGGKR